MDEIFKLLTRKGYTRSGRHFSAHYCSRSPNYLAMGYGVSPSAALAVVRKLAEERRWLTALRVLRMIFLGRREQRKEAA